jgi:peroxiredoxin
MILPTNYDKKGQANMKYFNKVSLTDTKGKTIDRWSSRFATIVNDGLVVVGWRHMNPDMKLVYPSLDRAFRQLG